MTPFPTSAFWRSEARAADLARALLLYLVTRAALALFVWLTGHQYGCGHAGCLDQGFYPDNFLLNGLFQWDAKLYREVLRSGYYLGQDYETTAPFFPGFPVAAWLAGRPLGSTNWGGILVNHLASIAGAYCVARLARRLAIGEAATAPKVPAEATLFWLASPLTFFFCVFLSESLFAFLSLLVLLGVSAGRYWVVLVAGIWLTATRNNGIVVVGAAALLAWERRREVPVGRWGWAALACTPLGLVAFSIYEHLVVGDALAWVHVQLRWNRFLTTPWRTIADDWRGFPGLAARDPWRMYRVQELLALALVAPLFALRRRFNIPWALLVLGIAEWLLPLTSHSVISAARYQAGNVYFALAIPALLVGRPMLRGTCWMLFGMVLAWYASTWPYGVWAS